MNFIVLIYIGTTLGSVLAALPQLKQIWKMKNSDEFNLLSWVSWALAQLTALFYSLYLHSIPYLIVNILWLSFYVTMIGLIIKYRKGKAIPVTEEVTDEDTRQ
jgi:uncharacterized protein with PQ loop repeat